MNLIAKFEINLSIFIEILVPDLKDKFNHYCEPTEKLHMFDEVTIVLSNNNDKNIIAKDDVNCLVFVLKGRLEHALNNERDLPDFIKIGELGEYYNVNIASEIPNKINYFNFWLWSSQGPQTWLYSRNKKIYLEVSQSYPWLYTDLEESKLEEGFISFEEYMKTYQPIFVGEIPKNVAEKWITQCDQILDTMIMVKP